VHQSWQLIYGQFMMQGQKNIKLHPTVCVWYFNRSVSSIDQHI